MIRKNRKFHVKICKNFKIFDQTSQISYTKWYWWRKNCKIRNKICDKTFNVKLKYACFAKKYNHIFCEICEWIKFDVHEWIRFDFCEWIQFDICKWIRFDICKWLCFDICERNFCDFCDFCDFCEWIFCNTIASCQRFILKINQCFLNTISQCKNNKKNCKTQIYTY